MSIEDTLRQDMKSAMRAGERERLSVIRMALAAIKDREIETRAELGDAEVLAVIGKLVKQRRDSVTQYEAGGRDDLAAKERREIEFLSGYMPTPLDATELADLVARAIADTGATGLRDMGKVMALIKTEAQGRADMSEVSRLVKARLGG